MKTETAIGLDVGQVRDPSAIAIVERAEVQGEWDAAAFRYRTEGALRLRYLERVPLGTPYAGVVDRVRWMAGRLRGSGECRVAVDATGVGRPVVELLLGAGVGCEVMPVVVTGGEAETKAQGYWRVPKRDLIAGLQVVLQNGELQIAAELALGPALVREMAEMRVKVTAEGNARYGAWREGEHDDLVFAVALACWAVRRTHPVGAGEWGERPERLL